VWGEVALVEALAKATAPRVRSTTRDKIAAEIVAGLDWAAERLLKLYETYAEVEAPAPKPKVVAPRPAVVKPLPKPLPKEL
jgi:hypothetical protein